MSTDNRNLPERLHARNSLTLGRGREISLEGLPEHDRQELHKQLAKGMVDLTVYAEKLGVERDALAAALNDMARETQTAVKEGIQITATRTQTDTLGKTEVIMGNTDTAKAGKLSRSQSGLPDYTLAYIIAAVIIVIVIAIVAR